MMPGMMPLTCPWPALLKPRIGASVPYLAQDQQGIQSIRFGQFLVGSRVLSFMFGLPPIGSLFSV